MDELIVKIATATPLELSEYLNAYLCSIEKECKGVKLAFKLSIQEVIDKLELNLSIYKNAYTLGTLSFCPIKGVTVPTEKLIKSTKMTIDYLLEVSNTYQGNGSVERIEEVAEKKEETKVWLKPEETAERFGLSYNYIKDRKWRIRNDFPFKGYDEKKGAYKDVVFYVDDVESWIKRKKK